MAAIHLHLLRYCEHSGYYVRLCQNYNPNKRQIALKSMEFSFWREIFGEMSSLVPISYDADTEPIYVTIAGTAEPLNAEV